MRKSRFSRTEIDNAARPEEPGGPEPENAGEVVFSGCCDCKLAGECSEVLTTTGVMVFFGEAATKKGDWSQRSRAGLLESGDGNCSLDGLQEPAAPVFIVRKWPRGHCSSRISNPWIVEIPVRFVDESLRAGVRRLRM